MNRRAIEQHDPARDLARNRLALAAVQWALPIGLVALALGYEYTEHVMVDHQNVMALISPEVVLFGLIGPGAVAATIFVMRRMLEHQADAQAELARLNASLEQKVADRTAALAAQNTALESANVQLRKLDELKSDFVAMVSHELRAPLTILNGALEVAQTSRESFPPATRNTLDLMTSESRRLTDFVRTILDVSRIEAGKVDVNLGAVALPPLLEQAAALILSHSHRPIVRDYASDLPPALADETLLEQVMMNLLRNADKYSPAGRPILLSVRQVDPGHLRVGVRDQGPGIAPIQQEFVFERFARGVNGESAPPGWGLGLYLSR
ncbi:MAG: hypothetical protein K1X39_14880, partial [Thermoflexales bacterium]|nr:hypothetical protein [Thermoflexales bacterium]